MFCLWLLIWYSKLWIRPLPKGKNKKVVELMKDELGGKVMKEFVRLRAKASSYLIDDGSEDK